MKYERKKGTLSFEELLPEFFERHGLQQEINLEAIRDKWKEFAGPILAIHTDPEELENGVLTVFSDHSLFSGELLANKKTIIAAINRYFNEKPVRVLRETTYRKGQQQNVFTRRRKEDNRN